MQAGSINHLTTNHAKPVYIWHSPAIKHGAGASVAVTVKLPKTMHVDGFPSETYSVANNAVTVLRVRRQQ
jgi:hypothetical protein